MKTCYPGHTDWNATLKNLPLTFGGMCKLPQSRGGACFCTRGAMQGYAVSSLFSRWQKP